MRCKIFYKHDNQNFYKYIFLGVSFQKMIRMLSLTMSCPNFTRKRMMRIRPPHHHPRKGGDPRVTRRRTSQKVLSRSSGNCTCRPVKSSFLIPWKTLTRKCVISLHPKSKTKVSRSLNLHQNVSNHLQNAIGLLFWVKRSGKNSASIPPRALLEAGAVFICVTVFTVKLL